MIRLAPCYAELATTTNFSFLRGASHPEEMVAGAAALGLAGIGIADRNTLAGVVRAHVYARENRDGARALARRHGGAAGLRRRRARCPRLSQGPRRLRAALSAAQRRQPARAERRVPFAFRRIAGERGGAAGDRGAALIPCGRGAARARPDEGSRRRRIRRRLRATLTPSPPAGEGGEGGASPNCARRSGAGCGSAPVRATARTCAAGWRRGRRWRASSARR